MSRLYGGKYYDRKLNRRFRVHAESRDAVVWDIDDINKLVRCKIQNSKRIYPLSLCTKLADSSRMGKRGNAVRIIHRGGVRGFFEVAGHGRAVPTPIAGADQFPAPEDLADGIISGGVVTLWVDEGGDPMGIKIGATSYRISGEVYALNLSGGYAVMDDALLGDMGDTGNYQYMGSG